MSKSMRKITYYENILEFKENTKEKLNLNEINNLQLCRTCLIDTTEDDVNIEKMTIMDLMQGRFLNVSDMLAKATDIKVTTTENLPLKVCKECFTKITQLYYFSIQVHKADNVLKRLASKIKGDQEIIEACKPEENVTQNGEQEDNLIYEVEEVFDCLEDLEKVEGISNTQTDETKPICEVLENPEDVEEMSEFIEELSENEPVLLKAEEYDDLSEFFKDESNMENDLIDESEETSDFDNVESFKDTLTATTITTEKVRYKLQKLKRVSSNVTRMSGYRHKQPRVTSPLLHDFSCAICQENFDRQQDLVLHVRESHPNSKAYKCRVCGTLFSHIQSLSRHMNTHKEAVVLNECKFCSKTFMRADDLKRHLRVHTGERPYVCSICEKTFQQQFDLKNHTERHVHGDISLQPKIFECTECEHSYISRNGLYLHKKKHHGQDFNGKELEYDCSFCEKSFHFQSELRRHEQTHFLPDLIKCTECNKAFKSYNGIYLHKKKHHKTTNQTDKEFLEENQKDEDITTMKSEQEVNEIIIKTP